MEFYNPLVFETLEWGGVQQPLAGDQTAMSRLETMMVVSAALTLLLGASLLWLLFRRKLVQSRGSTPPHG